MGIAKVLTDKIRFPENTGIGNAPTWIEDAEVHVNEATGTYVVKRRHGPQAGSPTRPVYMDSDGQPQELGYTINSNVPDHAVFGITVDSSSAEEDNIKLSWGESFVAVGDIEVDSGGYVTKLILQQYTLPLATIVAAESLSPEQEEATHVWIKLDSESESESETEEVSVDMDYGQTYDIITKITTSSSGYVQSITRGSITLPASCSMVTDFEPLSKEVIIWIKPGMEDVQVETISNVAAVDFSESPYISIETSSYTEVAQVDIVATNGQVLSIKPDTIGSSTIWYPDSEGEWGSHGQPIEPEDKVYFTYNTQDNVTTISFDANMVCAALGIESNDTELTFRVYLEQV